MAPFRVGSARVVLVKLFPAAFARRAVEFRRDPAGEASAPASHSERITISENARAASQGAPPPAVGDVRWYRAVRPANGRARGAAAEVERGSGAPGAAPAANGAAAARSALAAIAAYRAGMALAT